MAGILISTLGRSTACHRSLGRGDRCPRCRGRGPGRPRSRPGRRRRGRRRRPARMMSQALRTSSVVSSKIAWSTRRRRRRRARGPGRRTARRRRAPPAKIVGLVVTPTTWRLLDEVGEVAGLDALARQVVEPDGDSRVGQGLQAVGHGVPPAMWIGLRAVAGWPLSRWPADAVLGGVGDGLGGDAELLVDPRVVGRGAVVLDRDDPAVVADDLAPALGDAGLDRDAGLDGRRDHGLAVGRRPARRTTRGTASTRRGPATPSSASSSRACDGELDLGAGADQDHVGQSPPSVSSRT